MHAKYGFGWSGFPCATAEIRLNKAGNERLQLEVTARTAPSAMATGRQATAPLRLDAKRAGFYASNQGASNDKI